LSVTSDPVDWQEFVGTAQRQGEHPKTVRPSEQIRTFERTFDNPLKGNYTFVIAGKTDDKLARQCAFMLFKEAFTRASYNTSPYWHSVFGGLKDRIRDDENFREYELGTPSLLVVSNLPDNGTAIKFEKARDLLEMYSGIPRIVVVAGDDPFAFCARHLFIPVTRLIYFD
jgi:hypothetical protein